jgi:hypothetical protein
LEAAASLQVLKEAVAEHGKPEIVNSDQGSQFTCKLSAWMAKAGRWIIFILKDFGVRSNTSIFT